MFYLRVTVIFALVFTFALLGMALQRRFGGRTIRNWAGEGPNPDLTPAEACLLFGRYAGVVVAIRFLDLVVRRVIRIDKVRPLTLARTGEVEPEERDAPVLRALNAKGRLDGDGVVDLLEDLYEGVNGKMAGYSGPETVTLNEDKISGLWEAVFERGIPNDAVIPWLLVREPTEVWDRLPEDGRWALLRDLYRVREQVRAGVELPASARDLRRRRKDGYFRWYREPRI